MTIIVPESCVPHLVPASSSRILLRSSHLQLFLYLSGPMFKGAQANPYDDIVGMSIDAECALFLCSSISDEQSKRQMRL